MDPGSHVGFQISTKNTNLVELPSSEHFWQVWLISVQQFQRRRFKCEKLTDGWTLTHDKKLARNVHWMVTLPDLCFWC
jgi:hypothetical protein